MTTTVCLTFDFDAVSLWINTFKLTSPTPISRGEYGANVGVPRILALLERHGIPATFFVPGHTADVFPDRVKAIRDHGHEIAAHGYLHESPVGLDRAQEANLLDRAEQALLRVANVKPIGYRSPAWDLSDYTISLLAERGYLYDSSLMSDDYTVFRARSGDKIGTDGGVTWGQLSSVLEFPVAWELDDFPYFAFMGRPINVGLRNPIDVFAIWKEEFDFCRSSVPGGVFTLTMHPQVIGRGPRLKQLDALIAHMRSQPDVRFSTMADAARRLAA
jgi:peptidoglycan/xylan/chitin deacetylase (PgdA/CDA1 family)